MGGFIGYAYATSRCTFYNCSNEGVVKANCSQFENDVAGVGGTNTGRKDALAINNGPPPSASSDGFWYATVAGDVATYVKTNQLAKNTFYLVTAKFPAWAAAQGSEDLQTEAAVKAFLLGVDIGDELPTLEINSIAFDGGNVIVGCTYPERPNGIVFVRVSDALATLGTGAATAVTSATVSFSRRLLLTRSKVG